MNYQELENASKSLSERGWKINLFRDDQSDAWVWLWRLPNGFQIQGWTDAIPKEVAFYLAVESVANVVYR